MREAPLNAGAYESFFGCPVRFGRTRNVLVTPTAALAVPLPWASPMAYRLSLRLLDSEADNLNRMPGLGRTVERALSRCLPRAAPLSEVAASLNLSERTLRRQLADVGLSYRALLDDSRKSRALDLLASGRRSLTEIGDETGFSDARSFIRAFKRWTGHSPALVRDRLRAPGQDDLAEGG
jgi:AraC-like DNA-binding protein